MNDPGIKQEIFAVKALGDEIGYGNMMAIASALWRRALIETGSPESGAHVVSIVCELTKMGKKMHENEKKLYDQLIKEALQDAKP